MGIGGNKEKEKEVGGRERDELLVILPWKLLQ